MNTRRAATRAYLALTEGVCLRFSSHIVLSCVAFALNLDLRVGAVASRENCDALCDASSVKESACSWVKLLETLQIKVQICKVNLGGLRLFRATTGLLLGSRSSSFFLSSQPPTFDHLWESLGGWNRLDKPLNLKALCSTT